jgi:tetratricopeptide (TPR) repeat protein
MKTSIFIFWLIGLTYLGALGCENEYYTTNLAGKQTAQPDDYIPTSFLRSFDKEWVLNNLQEIEKKLSQKYDFKLHSDYAVNLSRIGKTREAQLILQKLIKIHPQEYNIMANLGTVYELNNRLDSAQYWLQKALARNPQAHKGSEWIHLKILETKIKFGRNLEWLKTHSALGLPINQLKTAPYDSDLYRQAQKVVSQLQYQLEERIPFTAAPDELTASLLIDLAELQTLFDIEDSYRIYHYALVYKMGDKSVLKQKINLLKSKILKLKLLIPEIKPEVAKDKPLKIADYTVKDFFAPNASETKSSNGFWFWLVLGAILLLVLALIMRRKAKA